MKPFCFRKMSENDETEMRFVKEECLTVVIKEEVVEEEGKN